MGDQTLQFLTPQQMTNFAASNQTGDTRYYTIEANQFRVRPTLSDTATIEITYYQRIPSLSDDVDTNWVLQQESDLYLYGSLAEAERYLKNDARVALWESEYQKALIQLDGSDKRDRWTGTPAKIRVMQ